MYFRKQIALWTRELGVKGAQRAFRRTYPEVGPRGGPAKSTCLYNLKRLNDPQDLSFENKVLIFYQKSS